MLCGMLRRRQTVCDVSSFYWACGLRSLSSPSAEDEDAALVRLLVQDAFQLSVREESSPISSTTTSPQEASPKVADVQHEEEKDQASPPELNAALNDDIRTSAASSTMSDCLTTSSNIKTSGSTDFDHLRSESSTKELAVGSQATVKGDEDSITDSRSLHAAAEPFSEIRRTPTSPLAVASCANSFLGVVHYLQWNCLQCQAYNSFSGSEDACRSCSAPAAASHKVMKPPVRHVTLMPQLWMCTHCTHINDTASASPQNAAPREQRSKFLCSLCSSPFSGVQAWTCPQCAHRCPRAAAQCPTCFLQRPVQWTCPACKHHKNSVFSLCCRQCKLERQTRYSNSIVRCEFCGDWNDVRWELCATCLAPTASTSDKTALPSRAGGGEGAPDGQIELRERWARVAGFPVRDSKGFLHSKTVEGAHQHVSPDRTEDATRNVVGETPSESASVSVSKADATPLRRKRSTMRLLDRAWWCSTCNVPQRRNASFCDICLQSRDHLQRVQCEHLERLKADGLANPVATGTATTDGLSVIPATADGDWRCPYCCALHAVEERQCCGHQREVPPGYWLCDECGSTNRHDRMTCLGCGQAQERVCPWTCAECAYRNAADAVICGQCGIPRKILVHSDSPDAEGTARASVPRDNVRASAADASPTSVVCSVCAAPNLAERMACYRCRARLQDFEWSCQACGHGQHDRQATRCSHCKAFRTFDLSEEVWVCEVCCTGVYSGGGLPVRTQCPICQAPRADTAPHFPARWKCPCGMYNRARVSLCPECGARRRLPSLHTVVSCPHCFRDTKLDVEEVCEHCGESLSNCFEVYENPIYTGSATPSLLESSNEDCDTEDGENGEAASDLSGEAR
ncbi:hypothetical protein ABL78_6871 [Leptomonas seymouri]|uniref:RanBP2-type domain-containing protein n=1 Tax=Leptomonas seymouri TaxID=5684 RepID=A0A0N1IHS2_LEPSE|nr:hypothetical protein ABL78_6871 [Leptomonas seymouri]|eukprot:KPI84068.1 hypothetical protein ABL78_6871 [Leptomonas seymouri]